MYEIKSFRAAMFFGLILKLTINSIRYIFGAGNGAFGIPNTLVSSTVKIWFLTILANIPINLGVLLVAGGFPNYASLPGDGGLAAVSWTVQIIQIPGVMIFLVLFTKKELPTTFLKSLIVSILNLMLALVLFITAVAILSGIGAVLSRCQERAERVLTTQSEKEPSAN